MVADSRLVPTKTPDGMELRDLLVETNLPENLCCVHKNYCVQFPETKKNSFTKCSKTD